MDEERKSVEKRWKEKRQLKDIEGVCEEKESSEGGGEERRGEEWFKRSNKTQRTLEEVGKVEGSGEEEMMRG